VAAKGPDAVREADIAVAEAYLRTQQPEMGLQILTPRVAEAQKDPAGDFSKGVLGIQARLLIATNREPEARALLAPMLKLSTDWRMFVWGRIAVESTPTLELARAWLAQLREAIPPDAIMEIETCAATRMMLADRFPSKLEEIRQETLTDLTKLSEKTPTGYVFESIGMIHHAMGDLTKAEAAYRRALEIDPENPRPTCLNNLANILFEGVRQEEALALATRAVEIDDKNDVKNADYTDTLAEAYARLSLTAEIKGDTAKVKSYAKEAAVNYKKVTTLRIGGPEPIVAAARTSSVPVSSAQPSSVTASSCGLPSSPKGWRK
jgi:tetratricopeptide (TPR) repeat protein